MHGPALDTTILEDAGSGFARGDIASIAPDQVRKQREIWLVDLFQETRRCSSLMWLEPVGPSHLLALQHKSTTPYLSLFSDLVRPRLMRYPLARSGSRVLEDSSYREPVHAWLYFNGPLELAAGSVMYRIRRSRWWLCGHEPENGR